MSSDTSCGSRDNLKLMLKIFKNQMPGLTIVHINAQSLNNKMDEFRDTFVNSAIDAICVSETWFRPDICDNIYTLPGYNIFRADRQSHGGGVAIFLKSGLHATVKCMSSQGDSIEYLFLEINCYSNEKMLIGCVYRPHNNIPYDMLLSCIETISFSYNNIAIAGDFNSNILSESHFSSSMELLGLVPTNTSVPTHFTSHSSSILDIFFVNNVANVLFYDQLAAPGFSKHDLLFLTYNYVMTYQDNRITYRDFKKINYNLLNHLTDEVPWDSIYHFDSVDEQISFVQNHICSIYNRCVPEKTITIKYSQPPWFNQRIKTLIDERNFSYRRWKRFRTSQLHEHFKNARRAVGKCITEAKTLYFHNKFQNAVNSRSKWNEIRKIGVGEKRNTQLEPNMNINELNENFVSINTVYPTENIYENMCMVAVENPFSFRCVNETEVLHSILSIKSNAIGTDEINPRFIKIIVPKILPYLTYIFNTVLTKSTFPLEWKHAKIVPIRKSKNEYRPIAILPYLSKALERIMANQIEHFLKSENLLSNWQSGFRKKRSCTTVLIDVIENLRQSMDNGMISFLLLLDHSKAFDTVNHNILVLKLMKLFNFSETSCKLISSYLTQRSQSVFYNNSWSNSLNVLKGVPQGSILGPLLFSMYINDLPDVPATSKIQMYADDVQLYTYCKLKDIQTCVSNINIDLDLIHCWAVNNALCLNPSKTKLILISKRNVTITDDLVVKIGNSVVNLVQVATNLGLTFNSTLTWTNHINATVGKVRGMLRNLWTVRLSTPFHIRMLLAKSYLIPTLLYGCEIFANCDADTSRKLNVAYNDIARYVFNKSRQARISQFTYQIFNLTFSNLLNVRCLLLLHKVIYTKEPEYLHKHLKFARSNRGLKLIQPRFATQTSERQYIVHSTRLWNNLPPNIQSISNATSFKNELFKFFK